MASPVLNAGKTVRITFAAYEAPGAVGGVQVTAVRPGDTMTYSQQAGSVAITCSADPSDATGMTGLFSAPANTSGNVTVQAVYKNSDGSQATGLQNLSVVNINDVVAVVPGTVSASF